MTSMIESLLSARLFLSPELCDNRIYFISNMSGHFSLYAMDYGGSVPEPLLPPDVALQNPELLGGYPFYVFPKLGKIVVVLDNHGDEKYRPVLIPIEGGFPEPLFPEIVDAQIFVYPCDASANKLYIGAASLKENINWLYQADLATGELQIMAKGQWPNFVADAGSDHIKAAVLEGYTAGDTMLSLWDKMSGNSTRLYGTPIQERTPGEEAPLSGIGAVCFTPTERGVLCTTALFDDAYSLGYIDLEQPGQMQPVSVNGIAHTGMGELTDVRHLQGDRYLVQYNIEACSWAYEGTFDERSRTFNIEHIICGRGILSNGVMTSISYDKGSDRYALSFSNASSPTQIYTVEGTDKKSVVRHTNERILGTPEAWLSQGANDPRVIERESRDVVENLQASGKEVEYLVFENEGHDVIKYENKVRCYNTITEFFKKQLNP